ncbi:MAG: mechanosensitive ion channel family protein [Pseudomonadota bacterium]|nr:mechanosensitive ion channel family protein [Pseudomonadota bacterium]
MENQTETFTGSLAPIEAAIAQVTALAAEYSLSVLGAVVLLVVGYAAAGLFERWSYRTLSRVKGFDETLRRFLSKTVRYGVLILVGVTVLAQFGVQTASIIAALGAAGLAIGLALQGTLQNVAAGIMLLVLRPFRVGEFVEVGNISGTIVEIGLFATELKTLDGLYVLAPNSELWNAPVTNYSRHGERRYDLTVGIGYDDDIALAEKTMMAIANGDERVLGEPAPQTFVSELGDSAVAVTLRFWTKTPDWFATTRDLTRRAKIEFDDRGLSIPFPQQDVHYHPVTASSAPARKPANARTSARASSGSRGTKAKRQ